MTVPINQAIADLYVSQGCAGFGVALDSEACDRLDALYHDWLDSGTVAESPEPAAPEPFSTAAVATPEPFTRPDQPAEGGGWIWIALTLAVLVGLGGAIAINRKPSSPQRLSKPLPLPTDEPTEAPRNLGS